MKYCAEYSKKLDLSLVQELTIRFRPNYTALAEFIKTHQSHTIIIYIEDPSEEIDMDFFKNLEYNSNIIFKLRDVDFSASQVEKIAKYDFPYFFDVKVDTIDKLWKFKELNPAYIYICNELCFDLIRVKNILLDTGIKLRTYPNVCQTSWNNCPSTQTFFIRPEDVDEYANYFDVLELYEEGLLAPNTTLRKYRDKSYDGDLGFLILNFDMEALDNKSIDPTFPTYRINCRKKCLMGGGCSMCLSIRLLAKALRKRNLEWKMEEEANGSER